MELTVNGEAIDYSGLPQHMQGAFKRYFENRISPGSFGVAVLTNDLIGACHRADHINQSRLFDIVKWLYNHAPAGSWGSLELYEAWIQGGQNEGHR
jgi:hypothetical protein